MFLIAGGSLEKKKIRHEKLRKKELFHKINFISYCFHYY
nr:MAG TPA: hypothetical protein [Caudoviricetes sp.]DAT61163.1 MAG TPA: hypothetical protein [Caudoviricetes sp.]